MTAGFHHLALVTADLKETVRFHEEALGMKLRAIFPLHGIPGGKHAFLEAGNGNEISFMQFGAPAAGLASADPPSEARAARSLRATGGSIVDEGLLTNSPSSLSLARATLLSTPSSEAISCTRGFATILLSGVHPGRADR